MTTPAPVTTSKATSTWFGLIPAFALHTLLVYMLALRVSPMLVRGWFAWIVPATQLHPSVSRLDWYLQHLELVTILPAMVAGYLNVARFLPAIVGGQAKEARREPAATWAWTIPALVLAYRIAQYHRASSVLFGSSMSAIKYFFDIQQTMPTRANFLSLDPSRVLAQMVVTAPFYAGIAYSLGALSSKYQILRKVFTFDNSEETLPQEPDNNDPTPAPPSSSPD